MWHRVLGRATDCCVHLPLCTVDVSVLLGLHRACPALSCEHAWRAAALCQDGSIVHPWHSAHAFDTRPPAAPRLPPQVEASQSMIRIVGLSATLPNYKDVGLFLGVNPDSGLFYFDARYRPVPLATQFVGVSERNLLAARNIMDEVAYLKVGRP